MKIKLGDGWGSALHLLQMLFLAIFAVFWGNEEGRTKQEPRELKGFP